MDPPVLFFIDLRPVVKTNKTNNNLKLDVFKSIRILNNIYDNSLEIYYNTNNNNDIEQLANLIYDNRKVHIFYRKYVNESYIYLGNLSEISLLEYKDVNEYFKYFHILIETAYNYKIPRTTNSYKNDILRHLNYYLSSNELKSIEKERLVDLNDIMIKRK